MKRIDPAEYMAQRPDKTHLAYYVTFKPNVLSDDLCDSLMQLYDKHPEHHIEQVQGDHLRFMQMNLTDCANKKLQPFYDLHSKIVSITTSAVDDYFRDVEADDAPTRIPKHYGFEQFRINRSANNGKDGFGLHVDVGNYASARRFVTVLYYLETNEEGGDASFPMLGFSLKPVKGSLLCFPSTWQYLHCGLKPISNPKYIMTTFCHYL